MADKIGLLALPTDADLLLSSVNASVSGIVITDHRKNDNPIIFCNDAFIKMTGYSRNEIIGRNCRFLQANDRIQEARSVLQRSIASGEPCTVELRNYKRDGTLFWNELYMSSVKDSEGSIKYFIGVQNDITTRKNTELRLQHVQDNFKKELDLRTRKLADSEEALGSIVENTRESLLLLDKYMIVLAANRAFIKTFNIGQEDIIGKLLFDASNNEWNIPELKTLLTQILPTQNPVIDYEITHDFSKSGKKILLINAHQIEFGGVFKDRILVALEDVTERRNNEKRKDDFLSIASHELRSPLTVIKGYIQLLEFQLAKIADEKVAQTFTKIIYNIDKLDNLVTSLLDASKIQAGLMDIYTEEFNIVEMIKNTIESMKHTGARHHIKLEGIEQAIVYADKQRLEQVVTNLLSNAIKYSPDQDAINVAVEIVSDFVKIVITDRGVGISEEDQKKIFQRFFRSYETQKKFPGMGIGLYVSEQIIKSYGGTLWVESETGKGSEFNFTVPLKHS